MAKKKSNIETQIETELRGFLLSFSESLAKLNYHGEFGTFSNYYYKCVDIRSLLNVLFSMVEELPNAEKRNAK